MLSILAISNRGDGYGFAKKLVKERNFVKFYSNSSVGEGAQLPKKTYDYETEDKTSDIVLFLTNTESFREVAERMVRMGTFVVGAGGILSALMDKQNLETFSKLVNFPKTDRPRGVEWEAVRFFNGEEYLPFTITSVVTRRMMDGERGAMAQCTSAVVEVIDNFKYDSVFEDIKGVLRKSEFIGPIGFGFDRTATGDQMLTVLLSLNLGVMYAFFELCNFTFSDLLFSLMSGEKFTGRFKTGYAISIMLSLPPFPFHYEAYAHLDDVLKLDDKALKHIVLEDYAIHNDSEVTGAYGCIGWVTAFGQDVREARRRAYRTINTCVLHKDVQYRTDVGVDENHLLLSLKKEESDAITEGKGEESNITERGGDSSIIQEEGDDRVVSSEEHGEGEATGSGDSI